jgi:two-component system response regulator AlgR
VRVLVVDDEPLARARLLRILAETDDGLVAIEAGNGPDALQRAQTDAVDIVLLDIRMPGMDGIEVAKHLKRLDRAPAVIFTTAYDSHALEAFEASAVDYLLKPIRKTRLKEALGRARTITGAQLKSLDARDATGAKSRSHVSASLQGNLKLVPVAEVRFFRAEHKYVVARHHAGELVLDESLNALEQEFGEAFLRVHRNALAAPAHVSALEKGRDGRYRLRFDGLDDSLEVSRRCISQVRRLLKGGS